MLEKGKDNLARFVFGCRFGEHQAWVYVEAETPEKALEVVPEDIKDKTCIHEVEKFTKDQIKKLHVKER